MNKFKFLYCSVFAVLFSVSSFADLGDFKRISIGDLLEISEENYERHTPFTVYPSTDVGMDEFEISSPKKYHLVARKAYSTSGVATCTGVLLRGVNADGELVLIGLSHDSGISNMLAENFFKEFITRGKRRKMVAFQVLLFSALAGQEQRVRIMNIARKLATKAKMRVGEGRHALELFGQVQVPNGNAAARAPYEWAKEVYEETTASVLPSIALMISKKGRPFIAFEVPEVPFESGPHLANFLVAVGRANRLTDIINYLNSLSPTQIEALRVWFLELHHSLGYYLFNCFEKLSEKSAHLNVQMPVLDAQLSESEKKFFGMSGNDETLSAYLENAAEHRSHEMDDALFYWFENQMADGE